MVVRISRCEEIFVECEPRCCGFAEMVLYFDGRFVFLAVSEMGIARARSEVIHNPGSEY